MRKLKLSLIFAFAVIGLSVFTALSANAAISYDHVCTDQVDFNIKYDLVRYNSRSEVNTSDLFTRAEVAYGIAKIHGANLSNNVNTGFTDVPSGHQYAGAIKWCADRGIVNGVGNNQFNPNGYVTRQDLCVIHYRYFTQYLGESLPTYRSAPSFSDSSSIASYAQAAVTALYRAEMINGFEDGTFRPTSNIQSTAAAVMQANLHAMKNVPDNAITVYVKDMTTGDFLEDVYVFFYEDRQSTADLYPLDEYLQTDYNGKATMTNLSYACGVNAYSNVYNSSATREIVGLKKRYAFINMSQRIAAYNAPIKGIATDEITREETEIDYSKIYSWAHGDYTGYAYDNDCGDDTCWWNHVDFCFRKYYYAKYPQNYGWRYNLDPNTGKNFLEFHQGVDISSIAGAFRITNGVTNVYNVFTGNSKVFESKYDLEKGMGNMVKVRKGVNDVYEYATYMHLNSRVVVEGDNLSGGDILGTVGTTGNSTGTHLHFQYAWILDDFPSTVTQKLKFFDPFTCIY